MVVSWQRTAVRWLPLLLWMAAIYVISDQPDDAVPSFGVWDLLVKKGAHFLAYAILAWLAYRVVENTRHPFLTALLITAVYAASDEYHQTFVPGRHGRGFDWIIDCLGGLGALYVIHRRWGLRQLARWFHSPSLPESQ